MSDVDKPSERPSGPADLRDARAVPEPPEIREPRVARERPSSPSFDARELRPQLERKAEPPSPAAAMESLLHDVPLEVSVELGRVRLPLGELATRLAPGSVIPLDKLSGALLDVRVQSRLIARAEAVAIGERCGIRILELVGGGES